MIYHVRKTAKTLIAADGRAALRTTMQPTMRLWRRSPLAQYIAHRRANVYLISFPRSGRTWLRTMIGTALCQHFQLDVAAPELVADLWKYHPQIPSIRLDHRAIRLEQPNKFKHKKIILLIRNPLDIGVSQYHFKQRQGEMEEPVFETVQNVVNSYNAWASFIQQHPACLIIKYEDLVTDPASILQKVFSFIDLPQINDGEVLQHTVNACAFTNLKQLANDPTRSLFYRPDNSEMVRSGKAGSSKVELPQSTYNELKQFVIQTLSSDLNYSFDE